MGNLGQKVINHGYNWCYYPKVLVVQKTHLVHLKRSSHLNHCCIVGRLSISVKSLDGQPKAKTNRSTGRAGYSVFFCWRKGLTGHIMQVVQACLQCRGLKCNCQQNMATNKKAWHSRPHNKETIEQFKFRITSLILMRFHCILFML